MVPQVMDTLFETHQREEQYFCPYLLAHIAHMCRPPSHKPILAHLMLKCGPLFYKTSYFPFRFVLYPKMEALLSSQIRLALSYHDWNVKFSIDTLCGFWSTPKHTLK